MKLPSRLPVQHPGRKVGAAVVVAILAAAVAWGVAVTPGVRVPVDKADDVFYDSFYRLRPVQRLGDDASVVIVAVDQKSLDAVNQMNDGNGFGWPWPRTFWGSLVQYFDAAGARAVVFDILFTERSVYVNEFDDDHEFAAAVGASKAPVVFGSMVGKDGTPGPFALKELEKPVFGAVNVITSDVFRVYPPDVHGFPSLAKQTLAAAKVDPPAMPTRPFLLHYYGPHQDGEGRFTFPYVSAATVLGAALGDEQAKQQVPPERFKDKIVILAPITVGTYDLKSSPLSAIYPGVEVQATAIENLIRGQRVLPVGPLATAAATFLSALVAALAVVFPRRVTLKVVGGAVAAVALIALSVALFQGDVIRWLPPAVPLLAVVLGTVGAFAWSYFTEDRQRRVVLKALSQYVSPAVAEQIAKDPSRLALGGERRDMTVMFTDIAGFTNLTETMEVEALSTMLNFYLDEMSGVVLSQDGTLDKYIGDAIMSFWNAPIDQADHALRACRAAIGMRDRERQIRPRLAELGATGMLTRIGLNSGPMAVGNMGSDRKFNYTVLGDSVNLGSRLEGANKFYGTQILLAQTTAELVKGRFAMRQVDVLRVKGKQRPMAVYELIAEGPPDEATRQLIERYESAFAAYQRQQWDEAEARLDELLRETPEDGPSVTLKARIAKFRAHPPGAGWDGVYEAKEK